MTGSSRFLGPLLIKELRLHLLSRRFGVLSLLMLTMMVVNTFILTHDWRQQQDLFEAGQARAETALKEAGTYSELRLTVHRPPELLGLLGRGLEDRSPRSATLAGGYDITRFTSGPAHGQPTALVPVDFSRIVVLIMSLLALVLTHDGINGERLQGTLQLGLAYGTPRRHVLAGKYLGALLASLVPFLAASGLWLAIVQLRTDALFDGPALLAVGLALLLSLLYLSAFLWLGLMTSCVTSHPTTSLILGLLLWTGLVVVYPAVAFQGAILGSPAEDPWFQARRTHGSIDPTDEDAVAAFESATWASARRSANLLRRGQTLQRLSPAAPYELAVAELAGTGLQSHLDFLARTRQTQATYEGWLQDKVEEHPQRERTRIGLVPLDLEGLPESRPPRRSLVRSLRSILPDVALLLGYNLSFLFVSFLMFRRYDPRP